MKQKTTYGLLIFVLIINSCRIHNRSDEKDLIKTQNPPDGVLITDNLYCDLTEVSNFHWCSYMYWTEGAYGKESKEYKNTLPDLTIWNEKDTCTIALNDYYLNHPSFRDYPVVGISQKQANEFSTWRSDRVFENMLIKIGVIAQNQQKNNPFTIEKFFTHKIERINFEKQITFYPLFKLPNNTERTIIIAYSDSVDNLYSQNYKSESIETKIIWCDIDPCSNTNPTREIISYKSPRKSLNIFDIRGNVSEWAEETNIVFGGSWQNTTFQISQSDIDSAVAPSKYIGFRNVCEYKKWNE